MIAVSSMDTLRTEKMVIGRATQTEPHPGGEAESRRTEARMSPETNMHELKNSGVGHTRDLGNGLNLGGFILRRGPNTPQKKGSKPTFHSSAFRSAATSLASMAAAMARCCW